MKDAVRQTHEGVILDLEISPGAKKISVEGYNPWRRRIEVKLSERAEKGKANSQLIFLLSDLFNVDTGKVQIITGMKNSKKSVMIIGANLEDILKVLTEK
ncbi:MAG: DUF167 domain-containing protein [Candidatus Methanoperedens sp.]|nr:DUF167 domain-containing protein [Candidatus Methanoperedens sp.]